MYIYIYIAQILPTQLTAHEISESTERITMKVRGNGNLASSKLIPTATSRGPFSLEHIWCSQDNEIPIVTVFNCCEKPVFNGLGAATVMVFLKFLVGDRVGGGGEGRDDEATG